jgi:hypothetical protein
MSCTAAKSPDAAELGSPCCEVADIFRNYGQSYRQHHPLPLSHLKTMRAIEICRTAELGGHLERCDHCGYERNAYNSCRNRHCPKCQALAKAEWLERRRTELLPVDYFHNVFTLPHELNPITLCNKTVVYDILFKSVAETLQEFAEDSKHGLGGRIGFTAVLHTWDQKLLSHVHLHCVIPAGVLSLDGRSWIPSRKNFLFSVKALSRVFRGKFVSYLKTAFTEGKLIFPGHLAPLATEENFLKSTNRLWKKDWIVYSKAPFNGPEKVLDYLSRYTHRVAIANHRLVKVEDGLVTFRYRDRSSDKSRLITIGAEEFIRRFLLHIIPDSYKRIRHFGFLANRCKKQQLRKCRELLGLCPDLPPSDEETLQPRMLRLTGADITQCPRCKQGHMKRVAELPMPLISASQKPSPVPIGFDTS